MKDREPMGIKSNAKHYLESVSEIRACRKRNKAEARMNFRIIFCLIILVHAAFARIVKDVTGMNSSSGPPSAPLLPETDAEPSVPPAPSPIIPTVASVEPVQSQVEAQPSHSHNQVGTGDEPFGSAALEPEEVLNPVPVDAANAPPASSGQPLEQDDDSSEESDEADKKH